MDKVHAFFDTPFFTDMPPIPGAREALTALSERFRFVVVTSRQHVIRDATLAWLDRHFPGLFHDVLFGNHWCGLGLTKDTQRGLASFKSIAELMYQLNREGDVAILCTTKQRLR
jgi:5'(3')-deoxyribonucleotidase